MTRTEQRTQRRRTRRLIWWKRHCLEIAVLVLLVFGFSIGWLSKSVAVSLSAKEEQEVMEVELTHTSFTAPVIEEQEEEAVVETIYFDVPLDTDLQDYIRELSEEYDIPMALILAIIGTESSYDPEAVSETSDYGLMQINRINHEWLAEDYGITNIMDPRQNILAGTVILDGNLDQFDTVEQAVMAYNLGAGGARKQIRNGVFSTEYSQKVMCLYAKLNEETAPGAATP